MADSPTVRRWPVAVLLGLVLPVAVLLRFFVWPMPAAVRSPEAVVVLAGDASARLPVALRLAREGAGVLVVSVADGVDNAPTRSLCDEPGELTVWCFTAPGGDTRAEARALGELVAERGWTRIAVVTSSYHLTRAGLLVDRCTDADVELADARAPMSLERWGNAVLHELGGLAAAAAQPSC